MRFSYLTAGGERREANVDDEALAWAASVFGYYGGYVGPLATTSLAAAIAEYQRRLAEKTAIEAARAGAIRMEEMERTLRGDGEFGKARPPFRRPDRIPPLIRCPICQPEVFSYAGTVVSRVCSDCRAAGRERGL